MTDIMKPCICGSGLESHELLDGRGIYVSRICPQCEAKIKARYRPEILSDWYCTDDVDEPIEPEDGMSTRWTYALAKTDGTLEAHYSTGPMPTPEIERLIGGPYELIELADRTVLAARKDREAQRDIPLPLNPHYQYNIRGDVLVGKLSGKKFVGAMGVMV